MKILKIIFFTLSVIVFSSSCKKEFSLENANTIVPGGTWEFQEGATQYSGNVDSSFIEGIGGTKSLTITGKSSGGGEEFLITLFATDSFTVGSYRASISEAEFEYFTSAKTIFEGDFLTGEFLVNITSLSNNRITGTFSGDVEDSTGNTKQITVGKFTSTIDLSNNGSTQGPVSVGTLGANPDTCTPTVISGVFKQGIILSPLNTVEVQVTVTTPGTFNISTNVVNGVSFSKAGTFTTTGVQSVILDGNGTPQNQGAETFTVTYGSSHCIFTLISGPPDPPAEGTLGGAGGTCTPVTPAGTYKQGVVLDASNTITVQANVTTIGAYDITTNTVNGISFSASGSFATTGPQNVILNGSGTPTNSGVQAFAVSFGTSTCNFSITFEAPPAPATGTLGGGGGICTPVTPAGTYTQGESLGASNTITIQANVATAGSYNIATNTVNGVMFTSAGEFTVTGIQTVVLTGSGTPTNSGSQTFAVSFGTSSCNFSITFAAGLPAIYSCKIDGVFTTFTDQAIAKVVDDLTGEPDLYLDGSTSGTSNEFQIFINKNDASVITTGTYDEKHFIVFPGGYRIEVDYTLENPDMSTTLWNTSSNFLPPDNPAFTIVITTLSATRAKGTFSGSLTNIFEGSTGTKVITEGIFDLPIQ